MNIIQISLCSLCAVILIGCHKEDNLCLEQNIQLVYEIIEGDNTKTAIKTDEISDINIFIYGEDGILADCGYSTAPTISLSYYKESRYHIYAIANVGNITENNLLIYENGIKSYSLLISSYSGMADHLGRIPMCYYSNSYISIDKTLSIPLTRCISKVNLKIDTTMLSGVDIFDIISVSIKNLPRKLSLFTASKCGSADEILPDGDTKTGNALVGITSSGITFYTFENMQGTLLGENDKQSGKTFPESSIYQKICTYIEVSVNYRSKTMYGEGVKYRFYLGNDCTSNFDIVRNRCYNITMAPYDSGINEDSWRIDTSNLKQLPPPASISIPSDFSTYEGYSSTIIPTITPEEDSVLPLVWSIKNGKEYASVSQNGNITGIKRGKAEISVYFLDYPGISTSQEIEIKPAVTISTPYLEMMNYSLWPEMKDSGYPSTAKLNVDAAPNADIEWIIKRYGGQRNDINVTSGGYITLGAKASGHYTIEAKASTGDYYSGYACADVYYYLMYQDILHVSNGEMAEDGTCNVTVSMGTRWHDGRLPSGTFREMLSKKIIIDSRDGYYTTNIVGGQYITQETFLGLTFDTDYKTSAYKGLKPLSYAFSTVGSFGVSAMFRYDTGDWNYYFVKKEGGFYNDPTR